MTHAKTDLVDTFAAVLRDIMSATGLKQNIIAHMLGVSTKTMGRYFNEQAVPPVHRRHGIVHAFRDLPPPLVARVAASLGVSADFATHLPHRPIDPEHARRVVLEGLNDVMERLDTGPLRTRRALGLFLGRLAAAKIDPAAAQALLETK